ncbi:MAG TPA: hypothetical protein VGC67_17625 [Cellulomonas sp.]
MSDDCVEKIADGEVFAEHLDELGAGTLERIAEIIRDVVRFGERTTLDRGRTAWRSDGIGVIRDPSRRDMGSAFRMERKYFLELDENDCSQQ